MSVWATSIIKLVKITIVLAIINKIQILVINARMFLMQVPAIIDKIQILVTNARMFLILVPAITNKIQTLATNA